MAVSFNMKDKELLKGKYHKNGIISDYQVETLLKKIVCLEKFSSPPPKIKWSIPKVAVTR